MAEQEDSLIGRYSLIEDRHERLGAIMSHRMLSQELIEEDRIDADLVAGCVSRVWLRLAVLDERLIVQYAADAAIIRGLVALLVTLYHGSNAGEAATFNPRLLEELHLSKMLSSTRQNGLRNIVEAIRGAARNHVKLP